MLPPKADHYRVGAITFGPNGGNGWQPYASDSQPPTLVEALNGFPWDQLFPDFNRTLIYHDLDGNASRDLEIMNETGVAYFDPSSNSIRRFQTGAIWIKDGSPEVIQGGRVFERPTRTPLDNIYLGGFHIPFDGEHENYRNGADGWWYPVIGADFMSGQIANHSQSASERELGTSMKMAMLFATGESQLTPHVVVGTNGGFVYAIKPGAPAASQGMQPANLSFSSADLGYFVIGLDTGNLDDDPEDEIVCGVWLDNGTYVDWNQASPNPPNLDKNRGKLHILDPSHTGPTFVDEELTGDSSFPGALPNGKGIGSAVFGVRIDDVDNDGESEIWCTDQFHVYLFRRDSGGVWQCVYRSKDLGYFPGYYNNLFRVKDATGKTVKLIVVSPGYVMEFAVDPNALPVL